MRITNDRITLEASDIAQFSTAAQRALALPEFWRQPSASARTQKEVVEDLFNQAIAYTVELWKSSLGVSVQPLIEALQVEPDSGKRSQVEALIDQAKEVLDVKEDRKEAVGLNPTTEPAIPK